MPATASAFSINAAEAANGTEEDFSAVIRIMEQLAELEHAAKPRAGQR